MDLPWKPHFGVSCSCGKAMAISITPKQAALKDPTDILRTLSSDDQRAVAEFYNEHKAMGHEPEPGVIDTAPLPKA